MTPAIEAERLTVRYGDQAALDGLSLTVRRGETFGFLGSNGAGKSTFIKALIGILEPGAGLLRVHGGSPADKRVRSRIGYLPEEPAFPKFLTAEEALSYHARLSGLTRPEGRRRAARLLSRMGLERAARRRLGTYSKGMLQKVSLAQALLHDPDTLILDEPASGLDPLARMDLRELLKEQAASGKTVFFSSHELSEAELVCDSIAILRAGRLVRSGPLAETLREAGTLSLERFFLEAIGRGESR